ncbi:hypothetical protein SBF1_3980003 [Candidatus Desulfosporosinus infrequens]|uniref:Uncharacterized protein n=1 Tax=Candidatus Desulfosporosinus infrequens TaxID=2043169 RepID=A0A2U3L7W4_9FIRM|nr:hypothetical protein SBF1_3980003 [Candidatus Desulfosporosinus infrequens]
MELKPKSCFYYIVYPNFSVKLLLWLDLFGQFLFYPLELVKVGKES